VIAKVPQKTNTKESTVYYIKTHTLGHRREKHSSPANQIEPIELINYKIL